jgi:UrcA family protein
MQILLNVAAATAALFATPAFAGNAEPTPTQIIRFADLDLASPAGVATLDRRIRTAIEAACGPASDVDPAGQNRVRACRSAAAAEVQALRNRAIAAAARGDSAVLASAH